MGWESGQWTDRCWRRTRQIAAPTGRWALTVTVGCALAWAAVPSRIAAQGIAPVTAQATSLSKGLTLQVDTDSPGLCGYRRAKVQLLSNRVAKHDRLFKVNVRLVGWFGGQQSIEVSEELILPAGATLAEVSVLLPQLGLMNGLYVETREDGELVDGLSTWAGLPGANFANQIGRQPVVLVVADKYVDSRVVAKVVGFTGQNWNPSLAPNGTDTGLACLQVADSTRLDERWLAYSGYDLIILTLAEAREISQKRPAVWRAITDWVASGGNLVLYKVDPATDARPVDELLVAGRATPTVLSADAVPPGDPAQAGTAQPPGIWSGWIGWQTPAANDYQTRIQDSDWDSYYQSMDMAAGNGTDKSDDTTTATDADAPAEVGRPNGASTQDASEDPESIDLLLPEKPRVPQPGDPDFLWRPLSLGLVVVHRSPKLFPGTAESWGWLLNSLGPDRWLWARRHGLGMRSLNPDYWNFMIADLGNAPVMTFQVLITLFVIGIGPVNYLVLRQRKQLHLLLFTTPIFALLVTSGLFLFALFSDGIVTRVRDRSLTWLDPQAERAVCCARMSYYAGIAPWQGLIFPADTAVYPMGPRGSFNLNAGRNESRTIEWTDDQCLTSGWLSSRTPTQLITVRSRASALSLDLLEANGSSPRARNRLGCHVKWLLVRTADGSFRTASNLASGAESPLPAIELSAATTNGLAILREHRLTIPAGIDPEESSAWSSRFYWNTVDEGDPAWQNSRMETTIREALGDPARLMPGSFVAVVDRSPEVDWGLGSVRDLGGLHVMAGSWRAEPPATADHASAGQGADAGN